MDQRVSLITLGVADLDRSRRFYEALGWRRGNDDEASSSSRFRARSSPCGRGPRWRPRARVADSGAAFGGIALAYNARSQAEVDAVLAEAERPVRTILKPAWRLFWGGYSGYFADPDGHLWEVAWNPGWSLDRGPGEPLALKPSQLWTGRRRGCKTRRSRLCRRFQKPGGHE